MGIIKREGFKLISYVSDHRPYHIHIEYGGKEIGRFDIENQRPMEKAFKITGKLRRILKEEGYLL